MSCSCFCCVGRGCISHLIGSFAAYPSQCISSACTEVFPNQCQRNLYYGGSISAKYHSYNPPSRHLPPVNPPSPPQPPFVPNHHSNSMAWEYTILGLFGLVGLCIVSTIIWQCSRAKRQYIAIHSNSPNLMPIPSGASHTHCALSPPPQTPDNIATPLVSNPHPQYNTLVPEIPQQKPFQYQAAFAGNYPVHPIPPQGPVFQNHSLEPNAPTFQQHLNRFQVWNANNNSREAVQQDNVSEPPPQYSLLAEANEGHANQHGPSHT
ncbi:hypothetical protein BC833DRAFT_611387 [Globomyces pollinis-pini]|nr:hypothetical protein BC833DRAFT_611387 [Globomyces pollinis-pini]